MKTFLSLSLLFSALFAAAPASADPTCRDYPAFLQCVKQKQGNWQDCREWHCEGGESSFKEESLLQDVQDRGACDIGQCEYIRSERNRPNCRSGSSHGDGHLFRLMVNGKAIEVWGCRGDSDCQMYREHLLRKNNCQ